MRDRTYRPVSKEKKSARPTASRPRKRLAPRPLVPQPEANPSPSRDTLHYNQHPTTHPYLASTTPVDDEAVTQPHGRFISTDSTATATSSRPSTHYQRTVEQVAFPLMSVQNHPPTIPQGAPRQENLQEIVVQDRQRAIHQRIREQALLLAYMRMLYSSQPPQPRP